MTSTSRSTPTPSRRVNSSRNEKRTNNVLSSDALKIIHGRFPAEFQQKIIKGIETYLTSLVQTYGGDIKPDMLERISCAILKCSGSQYEKYEKTISLAKQDWRDLLVSAKFANSATIHLTWLKETLKKVDNSQLNQKKRA
jgi:hypothetical protein